MITATRKSAPVATCVAGTFFLTAGLSFAALAQSCVPDTTPDWMASTNLSAQVRPADCTRVEQTPPDFSWPDLSADAEYLVTLTYPDGHTRSNSVAHNWINWDEVLPAGSYTWQVQATNASGTQQSRSRPFTVDTAAVPFLVPDWTTLFNRAAAKAHPRVLPDPQTLATMLLQRQAGLSALLTEVDALLAAPATSEPASTSTPQVIEAETIAECERTLNAAFAYVATNQDKYYVEALRRAQNLASWDPHGATAYANVDQASLGIAEALTLAYDWLYPRLDPNQKNLLLAPILARAADMYNDIIAGRARIAVHPYDSHGNLTLTNLAGIAAVLAGDVPEAQIVLRDALPLAVNWTSPWGGEDGGFGNGTAYATWTTGDLLLGWYALRWMVGVDLSQKAWMRNYAKFLAYFIPPGTPAGVFGDGAEELLTETWASFAKAYTLFAPSPLGRWYASQLTGEDASRLALLLAPPADSSPAPYPAGVPDAALFPSIGWVAMHSSLSDPARVSVYFKASPYGSFNHSHANQNSFVINAGGQRLAIESGYYDAYDTPHWWQWYKQTRAHNAITYDGGQGQFVFEQSGRLGPGALTSFLHQPDYDIVQADAAVAYGGSPTNQAKRSLVYLRPNLVLVYDKLASDTPHQWEWNIHALNTMNVISNQRISIANNGQSLCVDMLAGPSMQFGQNSLFTADPSGSWTPQWHGTFYSVTALSAAEFIALLNVGCTATTASATKSNGIWTVQVGSKTVTISDSAISVQ
ncbi:MAG TPA: DUF4962 domain-containing protein [Burkholderiales bacterium]|nr:DUF4962 domain-containing protein [Burkholderiales bacterium]